MKTNKRYLKVVACLCAFHAFNSNVFAQSTLGGGPSSTMRGGSAGTTQSSPLGPGSIDSSPNGTGVTGGINPGTGTTTPGTGSAGAMNNSFPQSQGTEQDRLGGRQSLDRLDDEAFEDRDDLGGIDEDEDIDRDIDRDRLDADRLGVGDRQIGSAPSTTDTVNPTR